jgi:hypothetical protein
MANALTVVEETAGTPLQPVEQKPDVAKYQKWFNAYEANKQNEIAEQVTHRRYYNDKQWTERELKILKRRGQAPIHDNRIKRKIDFLVGVEQRMRRDPKGYPRGPNDDKSAEVATAGMRYACDMNRWESVASEGTNDGLIDGIGVAFVGIKQGQNGLDPLIKHCQRDRFFYDPRSMRPDFSDARYMGLHLWLDIDEAKEKYPNKEKELEDMIEHANSAGALALVDQNYGTAWADFESRRVRVVEFWEKTAKGWTFCYFCGDVILEHGVSPYMDDEGKPDCPYVVWSPYVDETGDRYGPIRSMKPMQDEINHRRSKFLHILNARQVYTRKGDLDDVDETRRQLNRPDGVIEHNGEWGTTTGIVDNNADLAGQAELLAQSQSSLENLGPNPGLIGKGGGVADQSGRAILAQRDSGMTELSPVFERNRDWKLRVYRKVWARIKQAWTAPKWIRITDDKDAPQHIGINQYSMDPMTGQIAGENLIAQIDVDIIMDEGPDTMTMNEELMQTLSQLGPGAVPPKVLIELSNAPNKDKLFKLIDEAGAPNPQVAEMQARMAKLEEMLQAVKVDEARAKIENTRADTLNKLKTAATPAQAPTMSLASRLAPAPQADMAAAFMAMQAFPVNFGEPMLYEQSMAAGMQPSPMDEEQAQSQPMPHMPPGPMGGPPMPDMGMPLDQMPGGLPIDPQLAGM